MKKIIFSFFALALFVSPAIAQDGKKDLKEASKNISKYSSSPVANGAALTDAIKQIVSAFNDPVVSADPKAWITKGEFYATLLDGQLKARMLDPDFEFSHSDAGIDALKAFEKALSYDDKKNAKAITKALKGVEENISSMGIHLYSAEDYQGAYRYFAAEIDAYKLLQSQGESSRLDGEGLLADKYYFAGLTAFYAENYADSADKLKEAQKEGKEEGPLYQILFEALNKLGKESEALEYLQAGRANFPEETGLLFSEINYYLSKGKLSEMTERLELALAAEPDNNSIILTLGQVYDQLQIAAVESGNMDEAVEYFTNALVYYERALSNDPNNSDINYSIGALYYNKAAAITKPLNEAANDFSAAGNKKYDALKKEMDDYFDQALPYFLKADSINPKDRNALIALREIYVRKDMIEKSNEYKVRLEDLDN